MTASSGKWAGSKIDKSRLSAIVRKTVTTGLSGLVDGSTLLTGKVAPPEFAQAANSNDYSPSGRHLAGGPLAGT
jgi:hypothetical protein